MSYYRSFEGMRPDVVGAFAVCQYVLGTTLFPWLPSMLARPSFAISLAEAMSEDADVVVLGELALVCD